MNKLLMISMMVSVLGISPMASQASPEDDLKAFQGYFQKRFPNVPFEEFSNGVYSIDKIAREQWEAIEEFPPYEIDISEGKDLFNAPFKNGKTYASCFSNNGIGIKNRYPYFNPQTGQVHTLALDINNCRKDNNEKPLKYKKGKLASILAYMAYTTRGKKMDTKIPNDPRAQKAYNSGKSFYYARRGQLNMSCAHCHVDNAGKRIRAEVLSPAVGQLSHFPVYRAKWGELGTVHRRFIGCNRQVRAKPFSAQSAEYRNLEYFLTYMGNGITWNGPGMRR